MKHAILATLFLSLLGSGAFANNLKQSKSAKPAADPSGEIDRLVAKGLKEAGVKPNASVDDETFLRRVYLDIAGRIPTIEEAEKFHSSNYERKRAQLIEELLQSEGYVSHAYNFWADILRINAGLGNGANQAESAYQLWVKRALRDNLPYDEFVHAMVSGTGNIWDNGAVGYYQRDRGMPLDNMSNTVRIFLGTRLECAQCHDHPFDRWTQMDYYKMAAFSYGMNANRYDTPNRQALSQYERDRRANDFEAFKSAHELKSFPMITSERSMQQYLDRDDLPKLLERWGGMSEKQFRLLAEQSIKAFSGYEHERLQMRNAVNQLYQPIRYITTSERDDAVLKLPHDYQYSDADPHDPVSAGTMFGADINLEKIDGSTIKAYADWMTSEENPTFTRVIANRLWKRVFGLGLFEPIDELTEQTQVANPELLTYLEGLMRDLDYDMKAYLEILYNTETYQRAADTNEIVMGVPYHFQGPILRRMSAEQVWDSIVALALPEADSYRPRLKSQLAGIERVKQLYESLEGRPQDEYVAMVRELGQALAKNQPKQDKVRAELYKAREEERMEDYQEARKELSLLQKEARQLVSDIGYKHTGEKVDGGDLMAALGMTEMAMMSTTQAMDMDGSGEAGAVLTSLPKPKIGDPPADLDKTKQKAWRQQQNNEVRYYTSLVSKMARASELQSPAPRGHFLREFGQSDREVIENAASNASVPQALNLLNGTISEALTNPYAVFGSRVHDAGDEEEKIRMIFQAMLTREPSKNEMAIARAEIENFGDQAYEGLVWALLNTQQFLFVQ